MLIEGPLQWQNEIYLKHKWHNFRLIILIYGVILFR